MATDMEILCRAHERENDSRDLRAAGSKNWESYQVGASRTDIRRLKEAGMIHTVVQADGYVTKYKLTEKGREFVFASTMEKEFARVPAALVKEAMELVVGFEDVKESIALAIESQRRIHFLLEGPPASLKGDTEVWVQADQGIQAMPIADLKGRQFSALAVHPQTLRSGWYPAEVDSHEYEGEWVEIQGVGAPPFTVTATHSLVAYDSDRGCLIPWRAADISEGDILPMVSRWSPSAEMQTVPLGGDDILLDKELGFLLGFWLGDGGLSQGRVEAVTFTKNAPASLERIRCRLESLPRSGTYYRGGHIARKANTAHLIVQHHVLFIWLKEQFLHGDGTPGVHGRTGHWKLLPGWVFSAPEPFIRDLLHGYFFTDGTVTNGVISAVTMSYTLARDLALLLSRLGITPGLRHASKGAWQLVIRQIDAENFISKIGLFRDNPVTTAPLLHDESFKVPFPFSSDVAAGLTAALRKGKASRSFTMRAAEELVGGPWATRLQTLLGADIRWVRVRKVRRWYEPKQTVYDLSVPGAETFVLGNRVLVHNCAKSIMLEGVRSAVPGAYIVFGSRTSAAGLSDVLFQKQPQILLMDEADKMRSECFSVLLGLMESGEILETKAQKTRGIKLETMVIAACNSSKKFPPEFLSRFALHVHFPKYTREEFITVCRGFLSRAENCPPDVATTIGTLVHDYGLGDVRKARGVWQLMMEPSEAEMHRVIQMMLKYGPDGHRRRTKAAQESRMPGL